MSSIKQVTTPSASNKMACPGLDPRSGTTCGQCLGNKMTSYVVGYLQTVIWILGFIGLINKPAVQTKEIVFGVIIGLMMLSFAIILLIGLHKNKLSYIKCYLISCAVVTILIIIGFLVLLFTEPSRITFKTFIGEFIIIFLNILTFLAVRAFYLTM